MADINLLDQSQTYLLPLFKAYQGAYTDSGNSYQSSLGQGSNNFYNIRDFVSVKIASDPTDNRNIYVRPSPTVLNADQVLGTVALAGSTSTMVTEFSVNTIFIAPKLTQ